MAIHGGSAGGYTALRALTLHDLFRAGAVYYGVSDLEMLAEDTPKFGSRYHLRLVGPYPEGRDLYHARSPVHFAGDISAALIFFQGLDDPVVPPRQTEGIVQAVRRRVCPSPTSRSRARAMASGAQRRSGGLSKLSSTSTPASSVSSWRSRFRPVTIDNL